VGSPRLQEQEGLVVGGVPSPRMHRQGVGARRLSGVGAPRLHKLER